MWQVLETLTKKKIFFGSSSHRLLEHFLEFFSQPNSLETKTVPQRILCEKTKKSKLQPNGLKTKTAPQTGTEVTAVVGDTFFNIIIIPMEPYQPNGWKTEIRSTDLQLGLCGSGRKN